MKIKLFKRTTSTLIFAGLMLNLIATSLPLHAISFPEPGSAQEAAKQQRELQRWEKEQQKILSFPEPRSAQEAAEQQRELQRWEKEQQEIMQRTDQRAQQRADIDVKIALLKKRLKQMKKVRIAMIATLGTAGATIAIWGAGFFGSVALAVAAVSIAAPVSIPIGAGTMLVTGGGGLFIWGSTGSIVTVSLTKAVTLAVIFAGVSAGVGSVVALAPGLFAAVSKLFDLDHIRKTVTELEQIELTSPGTLTKEQKKVVAQLKGYLRSPIIGGIAQAIEEKKALNTIVQSVLQNNPQLAQSLGKKASKRLSKHIFWNWQLANYKEALASLAKSRLKKFHPKYMPIAIRKKITKAQLQKLYKKHPVLKGLQQPVNEFTNTIKRIRASFARVK